MSDIDASRLMGFLQRGFAAHTPRSNYDDFFSAAYQAIGPAALELIGDQVINYASANKPTEASAGRVKVTTAAYDDALRSLLQPGQDTLSLYSKVSVVQR